MLAHGPHTGSLNRLPMLSKTRTVTQPLPQLSVNRRQSTETMALRATMLIGPYSSLHRLRLSAPCLLRLDLQKDKRGCLLLRLLPAGALHGAWSMDCKSWHVTSQSHW